MQIIGDSVVRLTRDRVRLISLATPILVILVLVARNDSWIFTRVGWLDPWLYVGFGYDYSNPAFAAGDYKISRLPWVLAQFYVRSLFNPVTAQYILQIGCLSLEAIFFTLGMRRLLGDIPALVGAAFLVTITFAHGPSHSSAGADYHTALSGPLYAASFYILTRSAQAKSIVWHAITFGVVFGATLHTNILYVNYFPLLVVHWIVTRQQNGISANLTNCWNFFWCAIIGFAILTVFLGFINWCYGRVFLFFIPQFRTFLPMFADRSILTQWWRPWSSGWYKNEYYAGLLMAGVILATVLIPATIGVKTKVSNRTQLLNLCGQFLFLVGLWGLWQSLGYHALQPGYYAYPLWVPLAGVVASLIALRENKFTTMQLVVVSIATFCAFALPYSFEKYTVQIWKFLPEMPFAKVTLLYSAIFFSVLILGQFRLGLYASIILLGISNPLSTELPQYYTRSKCSFGKDNQLVAIAAHKYIAKLDPTFSQIFTWTPSPTVENVTVSACAEVPARYFADSIDFSGFVNLSPTPYQPIMDIENGRLREIASLSHPVIVLVTTEPKHALQLRDRFAVIGKQLGPPELVQFNNDSVSLPLYILR